MTSSARVVGALLRKDLLVELRTKEAIPAMALFSVVTYVVFRFGLDRTSLEGDLAAGVLWVTLLFAACLGIARLFVAEREQGGFDAFLLAPVDRTAMLWAKFGALLIFLLVVEVVAIPAFVILLLGPGFDPALLLVVLLADVGIAVVGTLASALAVQTRARDLIVPLVALPLLIPVIIGAAKGSSPLLAEGGGGLEGQWLAVLALYDVTFVLLAYALFDFLLED